MPQKTAASPPSTKATPPSGKPRIGVVGLGRMGANMARRLHDCGYPITAVYDRDKNTAQALAEELGSEPAPSLEAVTGAADVILTVVTDDRAQKAIYTAKKDNLLLSKTRGKVFVNCATVSPQVHVDLEKRITAKQAGALEGCMASSIPQARSGTLYLMVGGKKKTFQKVEPILADLSSSMRYIGPAGSAAQVKALVNMVMNMNTAALAEGLGLGEALGLDLGILREVFAQTGAASRVLETDGEDMIARDHECYFSAAHAAKDSGIANRLAHRRKVPVPLSEATEHQYRTLVEKGLGHLDKSAVAELTFPGRG
jgi:3-hydroxyisobutyrate dehydrogenase-like beta-hydroxyacid dehydrogenase